MSQQYFASGANQIPYFHCIFPQESNDEIHQLSLQVKQKRTQSSVFQGYKVLQKTREEASSNNVKTNNIFCKQKSEEEWGNIPLHRNIHMIFTVAISSQMQSSLVLSQVSLEVQIFIKKKQLTYYLCEDVPTLPPNILLVARTKRKIPLRKIFGYW